MIAVWFENQRRFSSSEAAHTQKLRNQLSNGALPDWIQLGYLSGSGPRFGASRMTMERLDGLLEAGKVVLPSDLEAIIPNDRIGGLVRTALAAPGKYSTLSNTDKFLVNGYLLTDTRIAPTLIASNLVDLREQYVAKGGDKSSLDPSSPTQYRILVQLAERGPYIGGQRASSNPYVHGTSPINFAGYCADKNYPLFAKILREEPVEPFYGYFIEPPSEFRGR